MIITMMIMVMMTMMIILVTMMIMTLIITMMTKPTSHDFPAIPPPMLEHMLGLEVQNQN